MTATTSTIDEEKLKVLIVDDDQTILKLHEKIILRFKAMVATARNGEEAVSLYRNGNSFDLVLMDKEMPIMDGVSATQELRKMGVTSMIVGVTSLTDEDQRRAFMDAGLNQCLGKPLTIDKISPILNQLMNI